MAVQHVHGNVHTGDVHQVQLAAGVIGPPDGIGVPAAGTQNIPRRANPVFVGRDELLAEVAALFTPPRAGGLAGGVRAAVGQAITGLGGIGKSELALQYATRRTGPGAVVWWADAEHAETLELALADLAYRLQPKATADEWTTPQAAAWAIGWLQAHTGWLLVLDNVDDAALITPLLGQLPAGDILITTRRHIPWHLHGVTPVTLEVLLRAASVELLQDTIGGPDAPGAPAPDGFDAEAADALAAELGDLPLALQQAGAYIAVNQLSLDSYLHRLRQQTGVVLGKTAPGADPERAVARVFALTIESLTEDHPAAVDILRALAWLAPVPLPRQVVTQPASAALRDGGAATAEVDELLGLLASYSLLTLTPGTVTVHRLLQATVRDHDRGVSPHDEAAAGLTRGQATALAWLGDALPADPAGNVAGWGLWRDLLPHLDALYDHLPPHLPHLGLADLLGETGIYLLVQGLHQHALPLHQRALAIIEAALGPDHPDTATVLASLASTLGELGRHTDALPLEQRALAIIEAALGPDHPDTATVLASLASTLGELGRHTDALPLEQRALAVTEAALGPDHPATALLRDNLAATLDALGRSADAVVVHGGHPTAIPSADDRSSRPPRP
ncbi:Tetratricopeptide repeat-containing protein [Geodermatophilus africanus]|uniref:Tetratricopeptide repeat-containing protein n=1 Tax=Geodermatophilus africanus TaxID=1137993 RepID=A0A1H3RFM1_9ACTN|nr:tetratricopeptide repeat protein [Geodermatophilus africanus]SDZ24524.1 Tetratricopeptide repeat-containing protein [Geodermatophilus africanus]